MPSPQVRYSSTADAVVASLNWSEARLTPLEVRLTREREDTIVAQIVATDGKKRRDLVLKQYLEYDRQPRPPRESARIEAETLRRLSQMRPSRSGISCAVPGVVIFDEARAAVVIEKANGRPLDEIVIAARNHHDIAQSETAVCEAGAWLRSMQEVTASKTDGRAILSTLAARANDDADIVAAQDSTVRKARHAIGEVLESLGKSLGPAALQAVRSHGDYWPGNVFVSENTVAVIDFEGSRDGLPLEDVAYFLIHLEMYFKYPMMHGQYDRLATAFLQGYGGDSVDGVALRFMTVIKALQTMARGGAAPSASLRNWLLRRTVRNTLMRSVRG